VGTDLSPVTDNWASSIMNGNLPTSLDGVTITVGGQLAYPDYISPTQINALAPDVCGQPACVAFGYRKDSSSGKVRLALSEEPIAGIGISEAEVVRTASHLRPAWRTAT
jgi:uncharacterized protein (TIGR03437 family)